MSKPITISIVGNAGPLKKSLKEADRTLADFGAGLKKFGIAAAASMGVLAAGIGKAAQAAAEDQKSFTLMANALRNVTGATHEQIRAIDQQIGRMSLQTGIADDRLRPAFAALARGTRDVATANRDFGLVLDISTALQMDATNVADALAKAYEGNFRGLRQLSPEMATLIKEGASMNEVLEVLRGNFGGATAEAADTFAGRMARLQVAFSEIVEQIGYAVLPFLERMAAFISDRVVPIVQEFADAFSQGGLGGVIDTAIDKLLGFYDQASGTTKAIISGTLALGAMLTAYKALTFIQTVTTLVNTFTAAVNASTVSMGAFQTTSLGLAKTVGVVFAAVAVSIDGLLRDNAFAGRKLMEGVAKLVNTVIAGIELAANSAVYAVNLLNQAYNAIPFLPDVPLLAPAKLGRISEDFGSAGLDARTPFTPGSGLRRGGPDGEGMPRIPVIPAIVPPPTPTPPSGGGGGGGGGGRRGGGGGGGGEFGSPGVDPFGTPGDFSDFARQAIENQFGAIQPFTMEELNALTSGAVYNVTVNTVSADANLPNLIVEALQTYNMTSGPIDVVVAR